MRVRTHRNQTDHRGTKAWFLLLTGAIGCCFLGVASTAGAEPVGPKIVLDTPRIDFGTVREGATVTRSVLVRNRGDTPLVIEKVISGCGCTTSSPATPVEVLAGASHSISISFATEGFSGAQARSIRILSNDPTQPFLEVSVRGEVVPVIAFQPPVVEFKNVVVGEEASAVAEVQLTVADNYAGGTVKARSLDPRVAVTPLAPHRFRVSLQSPPPTSADSEQPTSLEVGEIRSRISFEIRSSNGEPPVRRVIPLYAVLEHPLRFVPSKLTFRGDTRVGDAVLENRGMTPIAISELVSSNELVHASVVPLVEGKRYAVKVTIATDQVHEPLRATLKPEANDIPPGVNPLIVVLTKRASK